MKKAAVIAAVALLALSAAACGSQTDEATVKAEAQEQRNEAARDAQVAGRRVEAAAARAAQALSPLSPQPGRAVGAGANREVELTQEGGQLAREIVDTADGAVVQLVAGDTAPCVTALPEIEVRLDRLEAIVSELGTLGAGVGVDGLIDGSIDDLDHYLNGLRDGLGEAKGACSTLGY